MMSFKEPLDFSPASRLPDRGEDQPNLEVDRHLLDVARGEIAAVVGVQDLRDAADVPPRRCFSPDRLAKGERGLNRGGGIEEQEIARHCAAIVVKNNGQPRLAGLSLLVSQEDVELCVIRLPDGVGRFSLPAVDQVEAVAVRVRALVRQREQGGFELSDKPIDDGIARYTLSSIRCRLSHLAMDRCH